MRNKHPKGWMDTPHHIEFLKKDEDDERRDKRRCLFFTQKKALSSTTALLIFYAFQSIIHSTSTDSLSVVELAAS